MKKFFKLVETDVYIMELYQVEGGQAYVHVDIKDEPDFVPTINAKHKLSAKPEFKDYTFEVMTTSYGGLRPEEYEKFLKAQNQGLEAVKEFKTVLEHIKPEYT